MTEYYKLPKLYKYDDYDRCLQEFDAKAVYCLIDTVIKPNSTAAIWPLIEVSLKSTSRVPHSGGLKFLIDCRNFPTTPNVASGTIASSGVCA